MVLRNVRKKKPQRYLHVYLLPRMSWFWSSSAQALRGWTLWSGFRFRRKWRHPWGKILENSKKWRENWSSWTSQGKARKFKSPQLQGCKKSSLIMRRAQNLKKCPYFFTLTVKQIGRLFFKFLWPSQNIWTLMSAYPLNLAAFEWHTFWYIYVLFLFFRILMLQKKPKI